MATSNGVAASGKLAIICFAAIRVGGAGLFFAFTRIGDADLGHFGFAVVPVGLSIAAADGHPEIRTRDRTIGAKAK